MSSESGRAHFGLVNPATGVRPIKVFDQTTAQWNTLQRPPGVDGYLTAPPLAPAGVTYDRYFDFNYPSEWNRPVITVLGSFYQPDAPGAVFSKIFTPIRSKGTMKRLFDPSDVTTFTNIKSSRSGSSFYWGYNLHLKVEYANGTTRMVAMPDDSTSLKYWAVNLPDDGLQISKISLLYRPLCSRNTSDSTACNINHVSNAGVTAANFYNTATVYATWTP